MDKTLMSGKEVAEDKVPKDDTGGKVQKDIEEMETDETASPTKTADSDEADEELSEKPWPHYTPQDGDDLCSICGFLAKCPRALKIHSARKHGKLMKKNAKSTANPVEDGENASNAGPDENPEEVGLHKQNAGEADQNQEAEAGSGLDEVRAVAKDHGIYAKGSAKERTEDKTQETQEESVPTQVRRVSKRTPKPKIIYSCNYCGQEFRDKPLLEVHVNRHHTKDTPYTFDADENMDEEEAAALGNTLRVIPAPVAPKRLLSRFQLKCMSCDFRVGTSALLESHVRVKHPSQDWHRCKLCNFFSATAEWMQTHLSSDSHKQHQTGEKSTGSSSFENHVERVKRDSTGDDVVMDNVAEETGEEGESPLSEGDLESEEAVEAAAVVLAEGEASDEPPRKKRGRPKQATTTTCGYCGLVVSNATNLSVHVRRKHSKEYGYNCTLCNYSCVTKGDMDRHCITKKHVRRAQESANKKAVNTETNTPAQEPKAVSQNADKEAEPDSTGSKENSGEEQAKSDTSSKKSKYDSVNACSHCDFVAHSIPSLHLHVKRKHTKDFEFVCLACSYYAVTSREMSRHAATDKHKLKSQKYLEPVGNDGLRTLPLPVKLKEVIEQVEVEDTDPNPKPEAETVSPETAHIEESEVCSDDSQTVDGQHIAPATPPTEAGDAVACENAVKIVVMTGSVETQAETTSCTGEEADPATEAVLPATVSDTEKAPAELQPVVEQSTGQGMKGNSPLTETQLSRSNPFDPCIVSMKVLAEQEQALQEGLSLEGEAAVICLTGGSSVLPNFTAPSPAPHVKKIKPKEVKVKDETKGPTARIRCDDCGFMADGLSGLNVHISMKHPSKEKRFHCMVCGKSFYTESNLHQHLSSAAHLRNEQNSVEELPEGGATFKCVKCTDRFETEQELFVHIKEKHEELLREVNKYVLEDTEQINREREENQGSVCKYCGKVCKSSNSMAFLAHIRTHTGSKPFKCKICNFATAQLGDARNHVKRHLGMREYKCDICGWAFVMKKHLSTHLLGKHGVGQRKMRKFDCEVCERSFSEKWALNNHMKLHSGEKPYKCAWPSCHYAFLNLSAMKDHYRTHTGEKSYLCDLCGFAGGTRHALTKHRRQHTGERPFKCKLCNFASTTQSHLSRHKRVHTGEKPYRCPWCDYRSNCAENIRKHILHTGKHEGVKMYNCPKCDFATNSPTEFRNHLKEHHPDIENPDLAYLHAGIVSKSFECRLKGQGATFVQAEPGTTPSTRTLAEASIQDEPVQQVIIIQGYGDGDVDQTLEESAAATLQTLAMAGQVAEVLHITEDGQVIASGREVASGGAHLAGGSTQYVVLESGEARDELQAAARGGVAVAAAGQSHIVSESSTALDALLSAVSEMGQQEEMGGEISVPQAVLTAEAAEEVQRQVLEEVKQEQDDEPVIQGASQEEMQEVLQIAASQMMKEGLTQVIVNDEGTHYIVTELDGCTLQVEGGIYGEAGGMVQQAEQQAGAEMVVYLD
ncbi:zinc finger protein 407 [Myripristis murdjan]|uniref:zinc finger protein 407 n=1 Tax=Myripristis murdjan TaxID=586833 RepID=UPI001175FB27|nr:zinc finger protein 407 [Myripristis murdjan]XP_029927937.1 zinc finger protein 407 [Myripristis murdjan]XP_029927938.1 zinc finger protein 407 [Myripristis murdjan]